MNFNVKFKPYLVQYRYRLKPLFLQTKVSNEQLYGIMRMKIIIAILLGMCMQLHAGVYGQRLHLRERNASLEKILKKVEQQSGYTFFYNKKDLKEQIPVNIQVENETLVNTLDRIFANQPYSYSLHDKIIVIRHKSRPTPTVPQREELSSAKSKQYEIVGAVTDSLRNPISGVSVRVLGSERGTSTDSKGEFKIMAKLGERLSFSVVGYREHVQSITSEEQMTVMLVPDIADLEEVVVLGFGQSQKKIAQTGSLASISTKDLKQSPVANVTNALAGRLPGLITIQRSGEPGYDNSDLLIRGRSTFNSVAPLVTIDGVQKDYSAINLLDVNEIENITILKDASATALYGVKGANGVIIITTRRGVAGKPQIQVSSQTAVQSATRLPQILGSYEYALLSNEAYRNDNPEGILIPYGEIALEAYRTGINPLKYPNVNWMDEALKNSRLSQTNFNISGGSPKTRYFVNIGYTDQDGIYKSEKQPKYDPNVSFKRYNFRSNVDVDFDDDFNMSLNLFGAIENGNYPIPTAAELFDMLQKVTPNAFPIKYPTGFYAQTPGLLNPFYWLNTQGYSQNFNSSLSGMLSASRKLDFITEGLSIKGNYSFDGYFRNRFRRTRSERAAYYNGTGEYTDLDSYSYTQEDLPLTAPSSSFSQNRDIWMDISINYARTFDKHTFTGLLLANRTQKVLGGEIPYVSQGIVSRLTYNYQNKYFTEFNAGFNGTDNFAKNNRYGFFPAISAGWVVSEESFMRENPVLTFLKLRGSYGLTGNDQLNGRRWLFISEFNDFSGYNFGDPLVWLSGVGEGAISNPDVSWEVAKKTNIGIETKFLHDLFELNLDFFHEKRNDILITRGSVPSIIGIPGGNLAPVNFGKTENKGFEAELSHRKAIGEFSYFVKGNISFARNKIIFMDEEPKPFPYLSITGNPIGQFFGLKSDGFFNSREEIDNHPQQFGQVIPGDLRYVDLNGDDIIDQNDAGPIGKSDVPEVFYGIYLGINWKGFDASCLFQGADGFNILLSDQAAYEFVEGRNVLAHHLGRWTPETAGSATYPVLHYGFNNNNHRPSSFFLKDASYVRLKNAEIGYTFKRVKLFNDKQFNSIRLYANGMNLFTWDKVGGSYDPEMRSGSGNNYPQQKIYNFGLSVNF
ncbi:TonB-dependent receptor [Sphingobacterium chuzhouense]|uniref:TonB-dependent receptor n=1 Tax=Sphingobacterium chuzhouense TaxID=1742264 RepID=A0ABR7XS76_9SPHI|nr:TonB-dependent receptor [Sphingobacterium chuzhouense]MBD1422024.1 TonB-dependent receptor [Sphingobacterium chuzhouense]